MKTAKKIGKEQYLMPSTEVMKFYAQNCILQSSGEGAGDNPDPLFGPSLPFPSSPSLPAGFGF